MPITKKKKKLVRYPYDKWFKKQRYLITRGIDYFCQPHSMSVLIRGAAIQRGLKVGVKIDEKVLTIIVHKKNRGGKRK